MGKFWDSDVSVLSGDTEIQDRTSKQKRLVLKSSASAVCVLRGKRKSRDCTCKHLMFKPLDSGSSVLRDGGKSQDETCECLTMKSFDSGICVL